MKKSVFLLPFPVFIYFCNNFVNRTFQLMDSPFAFDKVAAGNSILGREKEIKAFCDTLRKQGKGVSMSTGPKSGKETIIREGLVRLKESGFNFLLCELNLYNIRSYPHFVDLFKRTMTECFREVNRNSLLSFDFNLDTLPPKKVFELPARIASEMSCIVVVYFKEFQNLLNFEGSEFHLDDLDRIWSKQTNVRYILTGSFINSMKTITEERKLFYYITHPIELPAIDKKNVCDYIVTTFLNSGRVIETEEALAIYDIAGGNMWYIKQLCGICFSMPVGYINRKIVNRARDSVISVYESTYLHTMKDLTFNQINLLQAIIDEVRRFSSSEVLDRYQLNSSANVARIKDALQKRELIAFDSEDGAFIIDPLFKYWLKNYYFA